MGPDRVTKIYRLAPTYCEDHWASECGETDEIIKTGKYCVYVRLDANGYADMLSRAEYYSQDDDDWWAEGLESIRASAKRVVAVLKKEGPPA